MPYFPGIPPEDGNEFRRWLADELNRLNPNVIEGQDYQGFKIHYTEPDKYEIGQMAFASGGSPGWNPGAGQGLYEYTELGWAKLGGGDGNVVPTSHSVLQDLTADDHTQYLTNARGDVRYYLKAYIDALTLQSLANVVITGVGDGEVLTYDSGTSKWINAVAVRDLDGLSDVALGSPIDGEVLAYDSDTNKWVNQPVVANQIDGGFANDVYLPIQNIDGGSA